MSPRRTTPNTRRLAVYAALGVVVLALIGLALDSIYGGNTASANSGIEETARIGVVQSSVTSSGNIGTPVSDSVDFGSSGTLTAVDTAVGATVHKGQLLGTIDPSDARLALSIAEDNLQMAEDNLQTLQQGATPSQQASNTASLESGGASVTSAQQTLSADQSTLTTAENQLQDDEALGCPATTSEASSGGGSSSNGSGSSSSGSGSGGEGSSALPSASPPAVSAPSATTGSASGLLTTSVTLNGSVDPDGASTSYWFEYGTSLSLGHSTTSVDAGAGGSSVSASLTVSGLEPDTGYVFKLVASNAEGTTSGSDLTFTTPQTSCAVDRDNISTDEQTVSRQQTAVLQAQDGLSSTEAQIDQSSTVSQATVLQDEVQVMQDRQTVSEDQTALAGTRVVAPISGTVTALNGSVGAAVSGSSTDQSSTGSGGSGTSANSASAASTASSTDASSSSSSSAFITITDLSDLDVVVGFAEADATDISVGQTATVTLAALPDTEVAGKVTTISPTPTVVSNVVTYDVTISLTDPPATVRDGMTADVSVITKSVSGVLELPSGAITTTGTGSTVTLLQGSTKTTTRVVLGLVGNTTTQIESGLAAGDVVIEPTVNIATTSGSTTTGGGFGGGGFGGGGGGAGLGGGSGFGGG